MRVLWRAIDQRFTRAHASDYLDGQLPDTGRCRNERPTSVCPHCRALLASLRHMIEALPGLAPPPPTGLADGVLERLRREA
jgi:anti-sigma factor RsiW